MLQQLVNLLSGAVQEHVVVSIRHYFQEFAHDNLPVRVVQGAKVIKMIDLHLGKLFEEVEDVAIIYRSHLAKILVRVVTGNVEHLLAVYILPILAEAQQTVKEEHRGTVALVLVGEYKIIV